MKKAVAKAHIYSHLYERKNTAELIALSLDKIAELHSDTKKVKSGNDNKDICRECLEEAPCMTVRIAEFHKKVPYGRARSEILHKSLDHIANIHYLENCYCDDEECDEPLTCNVCFEEAPCSTMSYLEKFMNN